MSALVETPNGEWSILYFSDWLQQQDTETIQESSHTSLFVPTNRELLKSFIPAGV
jgi:hypothetical protein